MEREIERLEERAREALLRGVMYCENMWFFCQTGPHNLTMTLGILSLILLIWNISLIIVITYLTGFVRFN